jgi:hypothetical protein
MIDQSSVDDKASLKEFILKEASDYQVMSLLVEGELPEEAYNPVAEGMIFSRLKEQLIQNYATISEVVEPSLLNNIIFEVDTLYPNSTSEWLSESQLDETGKLGYLSEVSIKSDKSKKMYDDSRTAGSQIQPNKSSQMYKDATAQQAKSRRAGSFIKADHSKKMYDRNKGNVAASQVKGHQAGEMGQYKGYNAGETGSAEKALKQRQADRAAEVNMNDPAGAGDKLSLWQRMAAAGKEVWGSVSKAASSKTGKGVAAGILATIAAYAGYKAYQRFLSKAARSCKGTSGAEKTECMAKFKAQGKAAQVKELKKGLSVCGKSSNPAKCKATINNKIMKLSSK